MKTPNPCKFLLLSACLFSSETEAQIPVTGMKLWLKADTGCYQSDSITPSENYTLVQTWLDQSGNGNHFYQTDAAKQPAYLTNVICGKPAIRFDVSRRTFLQSNMLHRRVNVFKYWVTDGAARFLFLLLPPTLESYRTIQEGIESPVYAKSLVAKYSQLNISSRSTLILDKLI